MAVFAFEQRWKPVGQTRSAVNRDGKATSNLTANESLFIICEVVMSVFYITVYIRQIQRCRSHDELRLQKAGYVTLRNIIVTQC